MEKPAKPVTVAEVPKFDGRFNRSVVTRKKIVDAFMALVYEGHITPTAELVAQRANVGLRTVFRHFDDLDTLYREISVKIDAQVLPLLNVRLDGPTWKERVLQSLDVRCEIYEAASNVFVAAQAHRHESTFLAENLVITAKKHRDLLVRLLPPHVSRNTTLTHALDLNLSFEAWIRLRQEQGRKPAQAREVMLLCVMSILATVSD
jgi:AcrR family transcriptional regulator